MGRRTPLQNTNPTNDLMEVPFEVARNIIIHFLYHAYIINPHLSDFIMSDDEVTELLNKIWEDGYQCQIKNY